MRNATPGPCVAV